MIKSGDLVKLNGASFDALVRMGIKADVSEFILKQATFKVVEVSPVTVKVMVRGRKIEVLRKYVEKVS